MSVAFNSDIISGVAPVMADSLRAQFRFNSIVGVRDIAELNRAVEFRNASDLINVCEARQTKYLGCIADEIAARRKNGDAGVVLIAGPSSSGKTTTSKRLANQLLIDLIVPKVISLDDYFVDRVNTPLDAQGDYDYESLYALDLERFKSDLQRLLAGGEVNIPTYSFELGRRIERERPLRLEPDEVLIIEGIHGLNPELTEGVDSRHLYKIFASAVPTVLNEEGEMLSSTDARLMRRIVRDHKYRHVSASDTLRRWASVRRGEERWIFPYCGEADAFFNTSLLYEFGAIRSSIEPLLKEVPSDSDVHGDALRLLELIERFHIVPTDKIPATSLLREFLGGSSFHY